MRRPTLNPQGLPAFGRWLGQFGTFSLLWILLLAIVPMAWGWQPRAIISGSMEPRIHVGDVVVSAPGTPAHLKAGQVYSFVDPSNPHRILTHRLYRENKDGTWQTKGDANPTPDGTPIRPSNIVGTPRILVPWVGLLSYWVYDGHPIYSVAAALILIALAWAGLSSLTAPAPPSVTTSRRERPGRHRKP